MRQAKIITGSLAATIFTLGGYGYFEVRTAQADPKKFYRGLYISGGEKNRIPTDVTVTTPTGLRLRPAGVKDLDTYDGILGDQKTMAMYLNGAQSRENILKRLKMYQDRVEKGYVWTGYAIERYSFMMTCIIGLLGSQSFENVVSHLPIQPNRELIGLFAIGNGDRKGEVQAAVVIGKRNQGKGYGRDTSRAGIALTVYLADKGHDVLFDGKLDPVTSVGATALDSNNPSIALLKKAGAEVVPDRTSLDGRKFWSTSIFELRKCISKEPISDEDITTHSCSPTK